MKIIGCDFHPGYQQIAMLDQETGEVVERAQWFEQKPVQLVGFSPRKVQSPKAEACSTCPSFDGKTDQRESP